MVISLYVQYNVLNFFIISAPASPPDSVTATVMSSTEILVRWDIVPPIDQNGIITMYEVLYEPQETFGGTIGSSMMTASQTSTLITGLQEFVSYDISVRAYTSIGEGPYSGEIVATTLEDSEYRNIH